MGRVEIGELIAETRAQEAHRDEVRTFEMVGNLCVECSHQCDSGGDGIPTHQSRVIDTREIGIITKKGISGYYGSLCLADNAPRRDDGEPRVCVTGLINEPKEVFTKY